MKETVFLLHLKLQFQWCGLYLQAPYRYKEPGKRIAHGLCLVKDSCSENGILIKARVPHFLRSCEKMKKKQKMQITSIENDRGNITNPKVLKILQLMSVVLLIKMY